MKSRRGAFSESSLEIDAGKLRYPDILIARKLAALFIPLIQHERNDKLRNIFEYYREICENFNLRR
jgi:hypothetical protein